MLPESFLSCLALLEGCFTSPSYQRFVTLMTGWVLCIKHTVTGVMRAAGVVGVREHSGYHRFFSRGAWKPERVGLALMQAVLMLLPSAVLRRSTVLAFQPQLDRARCRGAVSEVGQGAITARARPSVSDQ